VLQAEAVIISVWLTAAEAIRVTFAPRDVLAFPWSGLADRVGDDIIQPLRRTYATR
jgi:hypothetical protein